MMLLPMPGSERLGSIARRLRGVTGAVELHRFPDGESRLRIAGPVRGEDIVLAAFLDRPDAKVLPLLFAAETARDLGARSVGLVAPYLPYLRQDRRFHPGEGISARYFAGLLSRAVDWLVTVDPHLHRIASLGDVFGIPADAVHAAPQLARWIRRHVEAPIILGPDVESAQWVASVARLSEAPQAVFTKRRTGDRRVEVALPDLSAYAGRQPVLVDDVISSGATMASAARALRSAGWPAPVCLGVHAVFAPGADEALREAGAETVVTCNTVPHWSNAIEVDDLLAEAVSRRLGHVPARVTA
jgi:ribose-phosphate pyrophosphokinase